MREHYVSLEISMLFLSAATDKGTPANWAVYLQHTASSESGTWESHCLHKKIGESIAMLLAENSTQTATQAVTRVANRSFGNEDIFLNRPNCRTTGDNPTSAYLKLLFQSYQQN